MARQTMHVTPIASYFSAINIACDTDLPQLRAVSLEASQLLLRNAGYGVIRGDKHSDCLTVVSSQLIACVVMSCVLSTLVFQVTCQQLVELTANKTERLYLIIYVGPIQARPSPRSDAIRSKQIICQSADTFSKTQYLSYKKNV